MDVQAQIHAQPSTPVLRPWMHFVLRFAGWYNLAAGLAMMILYHEGFKLLGLSKPDFNLPIQLVGLLVAIFGIGYLMVNRSPLDNRNVLLLGFLSKLLGPLLALPFVFDGTLPMSMLIVFFFADTIYLLPFWLIYRHIGAMKLRAIDSPSHNNSLGKAA